VGVGGAQMRNIGPAGSGRGCVVGLMAWFPSRDFIQVLDGCSACAGRAAIALAGARLSQLAPLLLHCPWGGSKCHPGCVASRSRWGEGLAGCVETRRAACATGETPPSLSANPGPASCRSTMHELTATRMVDSRPMEALGRGRIR